MKQLTIVIPEGENNLSSIVGAYKIFSRANAYQIESGKPELFQIQLAGLSQEVQYYDGLFSVRPQVMIADVAQSDLIIIPSLNHSYLTALQANKPLVLWLSKQYKQGAEIATICTGAFLLAATGLLDGQKCSTHWAAANSFRMHFPNVQLQPDKLITDANGIYTNGGAYSFLNLILYLVEKFYDRETAIFCSKVFQIEMGRDSQSIFTMFSGQKQHGDDTIRKAQEYIEDHLTDKISFEALSAQFAVGRRNFDRRFIKATGNTPVEYTQRVKMEFAKKAFESSRKSIQEVMYEVGYSDDKAFREVFRKVTGLSPVAYKSRYNKEALSN